MTTERKPQPGDVVKAYLNELDEARLKDAEEARRQLLEAFRLPAALLEAAPRAAWQEQEDHHRALLDRVLGRRPAPRHTRDADCTVGADGCCTTCGVADGDPCPSCTGRRFHRDACPELEA